MTISGTDTVVDITATNTFSVGSLSLVKQASGTALGFLPPGTTVTLAVTCTREVADGTEAVVDAQPVIVPLDGTTVPLGVPLPIGARCWATETDDAGATTAEVDAGSPETAVEVTVESPDIVVTATNTYDPGFLEITKEVVRPPAGSPQFRLQVACRTTVNGAETVVPLADDGAIDLRAGETEQLAAPTGAISAVAELQPPAGVQVAFEDDDDTTPGGDTDGIVIIGGGGEVVRVTVTNTYPDPGGSLPRTGGGFDWDTAGRDPPDPRRDRDGVARPAQTGPVRRLIRSPPLPYAPCRARSPRQADDERRACP